MTDHFKAGPVGDGHEIHAFVDRDNPDGAAFFSINFLSGIVDAPARAALGRLILGHPPKHCDEQWIRAS